MSAYLLDAKFQRSVDRTIEELSRLGWLVSLHLKGVWAYLPPGEGEIIDRYIDLRGWRAREPEALFALAGEAAAWHLGYLDRAFEGRLAVWLPTDTRVPFGLRPHVSVIKLGWGARDASRLGPTPGLLRKRGLDLTRWAAGLPAFGPEALIVQLAARPASFRAWADLVSHLDDVARDISFSRLEKLLEGQTTSAWQRAAYLLHAGRRTDEAAGLLERRPKVAMATVQFGNGPNAVWVSQFRVVDRTIAPLRAALGKA
ncbi:MAG TPA: type IV toxin-antitoxin system AbiEi family antitoxin [Actinomycetota bacterium]